MNDEFWNNKTQLVTIDFLGKEEMSKTEKFLMEFHHDESSLEIINADIVVEFRPQSLTLKVFKEIYTNFKRVINYGRKLFKELFGEFGIKIQSFLKSVFCIDNFYKTYKDIVEYSYEREKSFTFNFPQSNSSFPNCGHFEPRYRVPQDIQRGRSIGYKVTHR